MKSLIQFAGLFFMFTCTLFIISDVLNANERKEEIEEALSISMRNTLKASDITSMYEMSEQDMRSELIRNLAENVNGDGAITVIVHEASDKGLLDVSITEQYAHNNGKVTSSALHRTLLVERYPKE